MDKIKKDYELITVLWSFVKQYGNDSRQQEDPFAYWQDIIAEIDRITQIHPSQVLHDMLMDWTCEFERRAKT